MEVTNNFGSIARGVNVIMRLQRRIQLLPHGLLMVILINRHSAHH